MEFRYVFSKNLELGLHQLEVNRISYIFVEIVIKKQYSEAK